MVSRVRLRPVGVDGDDLSQVFAGPGRDGSAIWTRSRVLAAWGIYAFAFSLTWPVIMLMMSSQWQFFSTICRCTVPEAWVTLAI